MRPLLTLLIVVLALSASGISSVIASTAGGNDDCCADDAADSTPDQQPPDGERDRCPPLCHACACSPTFSVPATVLVDRVVRVVERHVTFDASPQLPASPPGEGVFHPPRRAA